jgi:hypothetical protein
MPGSSGVKPASRSSMQMMLARFCRMHAQIGPIAHVTAGQGMVECSMAGRRSRFDSVRSSLCLASLRPVSRE